MLYMFCYCSILETGICVETFGYICWFDVHFMVIKWNQVITLFDVSLCFLNLVHPTRVTAMYQSSQVVLHVSFVRRTWAEHLVVLLQICVFSCS